MPPTDFNYTKSKSHGNICSKNYHNINNRVGIQELLSDDSKVPINNCNIGKVGDEVTWTEKMLPINLDCIESKNHCNNCDSNRNGNRVGDEE